MGMKCRRCLDEVFDDDWMKFRRCLDELSTMCGGILDHVCMAFAWDYDVEIKHVCEE